MRLFLVLLIFAWLEASAQTPNLNPCTGLPATPPYYTDVDLSKPWPTCSDPTLPRIDTNSAGIVGWRWCKAPNGVFAQWGVVTWDDFKVQPMLALELMAAGLSMNEAALETVSRKYGALTKPLAHPANAAVWCPAWPKIAATRPAAAASAPSAWIVAKNGTSTLRPTYLVTAGRRSTTSNGSVPVGSDCDTARGVVEGPLTFGYPAAAKPDSVALCVKR